MKEKEKMNIYKLMQTRNIKANVPGDTVAMEGICYE